MAAGARRSLLTPQDLYLFNQGNHTRLYSCMGAHPQRIAGGWGTTFAVWAPNARSVSVIGDFNAWRADAAPLSPKDHSGIWEGWYGGIGPGSLYKFHIVSRVGDHQVDKADPFARSCEQSPKTASVVWSNGYQWGDALWMRQRHQVNSGAAPWSIYEVHLGSWVRDPSDPGRLLGYRALADRLANHALALGFTHVELLPVMEHPLYSSWGYQTTGYFAPTARYGAPDDLMFLVDHLHQAGLGVIFDWVPGHFPSDAHGLSFFDGTHLFEHADPREGFHPDWHSLIFNYGRHEVRSFLKSSAEIWLDQYHGDGLRVDGVASMLYRDYSRPAGEWLPNVYGGRENLEAIRFLRELNDSIASAHPDALMIAEESTAWPGVSRPTRLDGLGFTAKWDMGWMHDTLDYIGRDPVHRKHHHDGITFRAVYAFSENFVLPLSHDEVTHGKGSLLSKMPGDRWQRFANLRLLYGFRVAQPGKKLLFMGAEIGDWREWDHDSSLDWDLLKDPLHASLLLWLKDLNRWYAAEPALHRSDFDYRGFAWVDGGDRDNSVLSFMRRETDGPGLLVAIFNFTPVVRHQYRIGLPAGGRWLEVLNGDALSYGGSGQGNLGSIDSEDLPWHGLPHSAALTLPPLALLVLRPDRPL